MTKKTVKKVKKHRHTWEPHTILVIVRIVQNIIYWSVNVVRRNMNYQSFLNNLN